jgi:hypothetical protein
VDALGDEPPKLLAIGQVINICDTPSSIITLTAQQLSEQGATCMHSTAWYRKTRPTFSDALAWGRRHIWDQSHFSRSPQETNMIEIPRTVFERFIDTVCYAA